MPSRMSGQHSVTQVVRHHLPKARIVSLVRHLLKKRPKCDRSQQSALEYQHDQAAIRTYC